MRLPHSTKITAQQILDERAAGEPAEGEAMMHEARKGNYLTRWSSTERTPRINEKEFLADVLRPFHGAIVKALASHFHDVFEGEDPADDPQLIHYAIDLIHDAGRPFGTFIDDDPIATAIHDVYRNGAEAALRHVERAIEWHAAFEAHRHTLVERRQAEFVTDEQQQLGVEFPEGRFDGVGVAPCFVIDDFLVNCFIFPIVALLVAEFAVGAMLVTHAQICARVVVRPSLMI
jgi:hypothetical protein